ncbi:hypothetical protein DSECCO2_659660 [anaerobic digester metagenome]
MIALFILGKTLTPISGLNHEMRLKSVHESKSEPHQTIVACINFTAISIINLISAQYANYHNLKAYPYYIFSAIFAFLLLCAAISMFQNRKISISSNIIRKEILPGFILIIILFTTTSSIASIIQVTDGLHRVTSNNHIETIKWSIQISSIFFLFNILYRSIISRHRDECFIEFERNIVTSPTTEQEIRNQYEIMLLGPSITKWLENSQTDLSALFNEIKDNISNATTELCKIEEINKDYEHEINKRKEAACQKVKTNIEKYLRYSEKLIDDVKSLLKQKAFSASQDALQQLVDSIGEKATEVRKINDDFCKKCKEITKQIQHDNTQIRSCPKGGQFNLITHPRST